jgi:hypothetical protein
MTLDDFIHKRWRFMPQLPDCPPEETVDPNDEWIDYEKEGEREEDFRRDEE